MVAVLVAVFKLFYKMAIKNLLRIISVLKLQGQNNGWSCNIGTCLINHSWPVLLTDYWLHVDQSDMDRQSSSLAIEQPLF